MSLITYIESSHDLGLAKEAKLEQVIIGQKDLSRFSKLSTEESVELAAKAKSLGLKVFLEWDAYHTESKFSSAVKAFNKLSVFPWDGVRTQDCGAMNYIYTNSSFPMHLILEAGNHNLLGIKTYLLNFNNRVQRVVLSIELTSERVKKYIAELKGVVECEYLICGPILLFYSPRKLVSAAFKQDDVEWQVVTAESEESAHKGFPVIENQHGSFMFHIKDFFLWDKLQEVKDIAIENLRVDLRRQDSLLPILDMNHFYHNPCQLDLADKIKKDYPNKIMRGFYKVNKTDVLFKKLKNHRVQREDQNYIGEVLDVQKEKYIAFKVESQIGLKDQDLLLLFNPDGKKIELQVSSMRSSASLETLSSARKGEIILLSYKRGVWPKAQAYLHHS